MKKTVGSQDRVVRGMLAVGAIVGSYVVGLATAWGIVLLVGAAVMVVTGATARCPLYSMFGISTCPREEEEPVIDQSQHIRHAA